MKRNFNDAKSVSELIRKLQRYKCVSKFDDDEIEAERLAHSLSDLEQSFIVILVNLLPKLVEVEDEEQAHLILLDIGEELRHILYHINDPRFFAYLKNE